MKEQQVFVAQTGVQMLVMGYLYRVEWADLPEEQRGEIDFERCLIRIRRGMAPAVVQSTVTHEVLHVISEELGLELTEEQIEGIEAGLRVQGAYIPGTGALAMFLPELPPAGPEPPPVGPNEGSDAPQHD